MTTKLKREIAQLQSKNQSENKRINGAHKSTSAKEKSLLEKKQKLIQKQSEKEKLGARFEGKLLTLINSFLH